jgi:hypothetical protein
MVTWEKGAKRYVVLAGGVNSDQCPQDAVYLLDVDTFTWTRLPATGSLLPR